MQTTLPSTILPHWTWHVKPSRSVKAVISDRM